MSHKLTKKQLQKLAQRIEPYLSKELPKKWKWDWKYWLGTVLTGLGLALTVLGLQIKPTVSLEPPINPEDILTTPVEISNDGILLAMKNVEVETFLAKVAYNNGDLESDNIGTEYAPPSETVEVGERYTVPLQRVFKLKNKIFFITKADIALVVNFTPQYLPFWKKTKVFRFITIPEGKNRLRFQQQPAGDILQEYKKTKEGLDNLLRQFNQNTH